MALKKRNAAISSKPPAVRCSPFRITLDHKNVDEASALSLELAPKLGPNLGRKTGTLRAYS